MERTKPVIILAIFFIAFYGTTTTIEATRQVPTKEEIYDEFYALHDHSDSNEFPSFEANYDAKAADQGGRGKGPGVGKGNDGYSPGIGGGYGGGGYGKGPGIGGGYGGGPGGGGGYGGDHGGDYGKGPGYGGGGYGGGSEGYHPGYGGGGYGGYGGGQEGYHPGYGGGGYSGYPYYPGIFGYPRIPFFSPWGWRGLPWLWPGRGYWKNQGKDVPGQVPKADSNKKSP